MDLLPFAPLKGVTFLQGDFLSPSVQQQLFHLLMPSSSEGKQSSGHSPGLVDSVISDMMANMSGIRSRDVENSLSLCEAALSFAIAVLKTRTSTVAGTASSTPGGTLV
jgi:23S rRNA (uridine2552-2'-O)-methyltransferase